MAKLRFLTNRWIWLGVLLVVLTVSAIVLPYWRPGYWVSSVNSQGSQNVDPPAG